jgi:hypothetical protein
MTALFGALLAVTAQAQTTISYDFNVDAADLQAKFSVNASGGNWSYASTGGIAGSGYFAPNGATTDSVVLKTALTNNGSFAISAFFKTGSSVGANGDVIGLGLYLSPTTQTSGDASVVRVIDGATSGLAANSWYLFTLNLTAGATTYTQTVTLEPYDSNGVSAGSAFNVITGGGYVYDAPALIGASTVYAGFYGGASGGAHNAVAIDNFSVTASAIPEPSTYAALFGLMTLILTAYRKRRRQTG